MSGMNPGCEDAMIARTATPKATPDGRRWSLLLLSAALLSTTSASAASTASPKTFASPEQAAEALDAAWVGGSTGQLLAIFGRAGQRLVSSGDPVAEKDAREKLAASFAEAHRLDTENPREVVIVLGKNEWPDPIPLVKHGQGWRFDVKAGDEQIIDRRIGHNEMNAIEVCRAYVMAQREYAAKDRQGDGLHEYAQRVSSTEGKRDGLYWKAAEGDEESPIGPFVAAAEAQGYGAASAEGAAPFHGYFFKTLTRQGWNAPGGPTEYIVKGHMTRGFALVAFPAKYGDSGVMTFLVNQHGIVFEKNLGADTTRLARQMTDYNPDPSWKIAQP
jgi:hypothetical protein